MQADYLLVPLFPVVILVLWPIPLWLDVRLLPFSGLPVVTRSEVRLLLTSFVLPTVPFVLLICGAPFLQVPRMISLLC
jgi:hypothetical protein